MGVALYQNPRLVSKGGSVDPRDLVSLFKEAWNKSAVISVSMEVEVEALKLKRFNFITRGNFNWIKAVAGRCQIFHRHNPFLLFLKVLAFNRP